MRVSQISKKVYLLVAVVAALFLPARAAKAVPEHYIIALDCALPRPYADIVKTLDNSTVAKVLESLGHEEGDYVTVVTFRFDHAQPDMDKFVNIPRLGGRKILWEKLPAGKRAFESLGRNFLGDAYNKHLALYPDGHPGGSLQTLARQYILTRAASPADSIRAARTHLVMVSDIRINGGTGPREEWHAMETSPGADHAGMQAIMKNVFDHAGKVNRYYTFDLEDIGADAEIVLSRLYDDNLKIQSFSVAPVHVPSIHGATDMSALIPVKRVRGGYALDFEVHSIYPLVEIDDVSVDFPANGISVHSVDDRISHRLASADLRSGDTVRLGMRLKYNDGIYNGTVLTPDDHPFELSIVQPYEKLENDKVLSVFTLPDWLWIGDGDNCEAAVSRMNYLVAFLLLVLVCIVFYFAWNRLTRFSPRNNEIVIKIHRNG